MFLKQCWQPEAVLASLLVGLGRRAGELPWLAGDRHVLSGRA
jgi:hypothetical protein